MTVFWKAATPQCAKAAVALRPSGRRLGILVREGAPTDVGASWRGAVDGDATEGGRQEMHTAPIRVTHGMASLQLRFTPRQHNQKRYVAVDIHTGDRIPSFRAEQYR